MIATGNASRCLVGVNIAPSSLNPIYSTAGSETLIESLVFDGRSFRDHHTFARPYRWSI